MSDLCRGPINVMAPRSRGISENTQIPACLTICAELTFTNRHADRSPGLQSNHCNQLTVTEKPKFFLFN